MAESDVIAYTFIIINMITSGRIIATRRRILCIVIQRQCNDSIYHSSLWFASCRVWKYQNNTARDLSFIYLLETFFPGTGRKSSIVHAYSFACIHNLLRRTATQYPADRVESAGTCNSSNKDGLNNPIRCPKTIASVVPINHPNLFSCTTRRCGGIDRYSFPNVSYIR